MALVATTGAGAAAFQIGPDVVTDVLTPSTGLWVPAPVTGEIVHVDAASGEVTARVAVADSGATLDVAETENGVVVLDRSTGSVSLVDPGLHEVVRKVGGLPADGSTFDIGPEVIVVADRASVALIDPLITGSTVVPIDGTIRSVAANGTDAVVDNELQRFSVGAEGTVDASTSSGHVVRVIDRVVALRGDRVTDLSGDEVGCFENNLSGPDEAIGTAERWVVAIDGSNVHVADLTNGECAVVRLGDSAGALGRPVVADRRVFVPETTTGAVYVINPDDGEFTRYQVLAPGLLRLRSRDDMVVAFDVAGPLAALIDRDGNAVLVDTSVESLSISTTPGDGDNAAAGDVGDAPAVAIEGADSVVAANGDDVLDANVLAMTIEDPTDDAPDVVSDGELVANFSFSATTVAVGEPVRFVDNSTGGPESWRWDFGDGTGDEGPEVNKSWDEPGTYPVTLTVQRGTDEDEISLSITVVPGEVALPPAADFVFSSTVVEVGDDVRFEDRSDGEIDRWRWDFGDGESATTPDASHSWSAPGRYTVRLTVANDQGSDRASVVIEVVDGLQAPRAVVTASTTRAALGEAVRFSGSSTTSPAAYTWNFGDGRTSNGADVVHVFLATGTYTVTLTAQNAAGRSTAEVTVVVSPPTLAPTAVIGTLPSVIEVGDPVSLSSLSTNSPDTEQWTFGDGATASGANVTHTWTSEGTYLLTLTATNIAGSNSVTETIEVVAELPPPVARIADFDPTPWVGEATEFLSASLDATSWRWDFGDGSTSTATNPLHTYTSPGQKTVTLTVTNRNGSDTTTVVVEPRIRPIASFEASARFIRAGDSVTFTDTSTGGPASWAWNFGDGSTSAARNPTHTYAATGTYPVTLTIENSLGDASTYGPIVISVDPAEPVLDSVGLAAGGDGVVTTLETVAFTAVVAADSGPIQLYEIDFGDGSGIFGGSSATFTQDYAAAGVYTVRMRAFGGLSEWSPWVSRSVTVVDPPAPQVTINPFADPQQLGPVAFSGSRTGGGPVGVWRWEIRRGSVVVGQYTGQSITHTFTDQGAHTVTLTAESPVAAVPDDVVSRGLEIVPPPPPSIDGIVATPTPATAGVQVSFSTQVSGSVALWEWNYEGTWETGTSTGQHVFNTTGVKNVRLRVTDAVGQTAQGQVQVRVNPAPSLTPISVSPASTVQTGATAALSSSDSNGLTGLTWNWRVYPTGQTPPSSPTYPNAGPSINHQFTGAGSWTVSVTAVDQNGVSDQEITFVTVQDPLVAEFDHSQTGPLQISFSDASTGASADTWLWSFSGGVGDTAAPNPVVSFPAPGAYLVTLTVWSGAQSDSVSRTITVT
ncbi:MAG: PKD domain-containing protein [Acidimicrobiales bacterium]